MSKEHIKHKVLVGEEWLEIGKKYMERARELDDFTSFLHGFVHTNSMQTIGKSGEARSAITVSTMKEVFEDPSKAAIVCANPDNAKRKIFDMRKNQSVEWFCRSMEHFDEIRKAIRMCKRNPSKTKEVIEILQRLHREGKLRGFNYKGMDMLALDSGCETVVLDMWLMKEFYNIPPDDLETRHKVQTRKGNYYPMRNQLIREIEETGADRGYGLGAWHVAKWLELSTGGDFKRAKTFVADLYQRRLSDF